MNILASLKELTEAKQAVFQELFELCALYTELEHEATVERLELCYDSEGTYTYSLHEEKIALLSEKLKEIESLLFAPTQTLREAVQELKAQRWEDLRKQTQEYGQNIEK